MLLLAESYLHQLDPFLIRFTGDYGIRYYGLSYAVGFVIAWLIIAWFTRTRRTPMTPKQVGDLMCWVIVGVLVGGRLGWAIFYQGGRPLVEFTSQFPFWKLLEITGGGMASHGGIIGVIAACWIYARRQKLSSLHLLDMGAFACCPGLGLGRLANLINGELWGHVLPAAQQSNVLPPGDPPWWSIKYPAEVTEIWAKSPSVTEHARSLLELERLRPIIGGDEFFYQNVVDAAKAGNEQVIEVLRPLLTAHYPSQVFQAITDGPILLGALALIWLKPRKPGVIGGWFLIVYGLLRIATEVFRQPDAPLMLGLSRGQALSVCMVLAGAVGLVIVARRDVAPLPGLRKPKSQDA